ncbi:MAG: hypothetical protein GF398_07490 [Chitinivibrionales bacterium]|nr:hypothetical protein [Chitinivibrionales bacterium]
MSTCSLSWKIIAGLPIMLMLNIVVQGEILQPRRLIDAHTAGVMPKAYFDFETRIYGSGDSTINGGGLSVGFVVGLTDRFNIGVSYGGDGILGRGAAKPNPWPGVLVKYRIIEENYHIPAFAIGFDWQGYGGVEDDYKGYVYKSQGFFLATSKNYLLFSTLNIGFHGAINYSLEDAAHIKWPNGFVGMDLGINEELYLAAEYDLALNSQAPSESKPYCNPLLGYLNLGIRWAFSESFYLEFDAKDVLQRKRLSKGSKEPLGWSRELKIVYITHF